MVKNGKNLLNVILWTMQHFLFFCLFLLFCFRVQTRIYCFFMPQLWYHTSLTKSISFTIINSNGWRFAPDGANRPAFTNLLSNSSETGSCLNLRIVRRLIINSYVLNFHSRFTINIFWKPLSYLIISLHSNSSY